MTGPKNELPTTKDLCALYSKNPDEALGGLKELPALDRLCIMIDMANALTDNALMTQAIEELEALSVDAGQDPERDYFLGNAFQGRSYILYDATDPTAETVLGDRFQARVRFAAAIGNSASSQITRTQAATNIGNLLRSSGRWVEAIDYFQDALKIFPKNGVAAFAEMKCLMGMHNAILQEETRYSGHADQTAMYDRIAFLAQTIEQNYDVIADFSGDTAVGLAKEYVSIAPKESHTKSGKIIVDYFRFIEQSALALSLHCSIEQYNSGKVDVIKFEKITTGFKQINTPEPFAILNILKSDYALARHLYYQSREMGMETDFVETTTPSDTSDYAIYGVQVSALVTSQRIAFDILDKIAVAVAGLFELKGAKSVTFDSVWRSKEKTDICETCRKSRTIDTRNETVFEAIKNGNFGLLALYELHRDLTKASDSSEGFLRRLKDSRNASTHRFTAIHTESIAFDRLQNTVVDHFKLTDFDKITMSSLRTARAAIFYFCDVVHKVEDNRKSRADTLVIETEVPPIRGIKY